MKNISKCLIVSIMCLLVTFGCEGPAGPAGVQGTAGKDGGYDKQIRLDFNIIDTLISTDTVGTTTAPPFRILKFNKSNYLNVDSIVFAAFLRTSDTAITCRLMLVVDTVAVDTLKSNKASFTFVESRNLFSILPSNKEVSLAVRLASSKKDTPVQALQPAVYLYRR